MSMAFGVTCMALLGLGYLPNRFIVIHSLAVGSMPEAILLSTALADKICLLRQQKRDLQRKERRLLEMAVRDELTGLFNKRWFSSKLRSEIEHSRRLSHPLSLMVVDVDHFKRFNDTYGHAAGDRVLTGLGEIIFSGIRDWDIGCRYGGEEFAFILPAADIETATRVSERLREEFGAASFSMDTTDGLCATISIGVAHFAPREDHDQLFEKADKALYFAMQNGRSRVVEAS